MNFKKAAWAAIIAAGVAAPLAAQPHAPKVDKALARSLASGCDTEHVIIRTREGYRAGLALSLLEHGDQVVGQHKSINAVSAELHCEDIAQVAAFDAVLSVSQDAVIGAYGLSSDSKGKTASARGRLNASRQNAIKAPKRGARAGLDDDSVDVAAEHKLAKMERSAERLAAGKKAAVEQEETFDTLGITGRRWPSKLAPGVMFGDVSTDPAPSGDHDILDDAAAPWSTVGVAVIDSGIHESLDFAGRITHFYDFTNGRVRKTAPSDRYGHGTHIAGLIASRFVGVAPDARLVGLKVLDDVGMGRTSNVIRAIEFATANKDALALRVINVSLGHPVFEPAATDPLVQAVEAAVRAGLVVITASGNYGINPATGEPGYTGVVSPGNAPSALTVGALNTFGTRGRRDDRIAPYSSRGPSWFDAFAKPDVAAPGHNVLSVAARGSKLRKENESRGGTGDYMRLSGTSMAAGISTGLVALMLQTNPGLTPNAVKMVLQFTAIPVHKANGDPYDALAQGAGSVNGSGALRVACAIDTTVPVGAKWLTAGMAFESTLGGEVLPWSQMMVWGPHRVKGDGVIDENRTAWLTSTIWGDGTNDDNIVWGTGAPGEDADNIVWGTLEDAGDNIVWGTNFIWSDDFQDNIVWGTSFDDDNIVWGTAVVWGNALIGVDDGDNIVWGTASDDEDNIVWGTITADNIVWGTLFERNIVWGTVRYSSDDLDNIVWGTSNGSGGREVVGTQSTPTSGRGKGRR